MARDPNAVDDPGRGITPPGTTTKARSQRERVIQGLIVPIVILLVFIAFTVKPALEQLAHATAKPEPTSTPYAYPTASSTPDGGDIAHLLTTQAAGAANSAAERAAALRKVGFFQATPAPTNAPETEAQKEARIAQEVRKAYDGINTINAPAGGAQSNPYGYNIVAGYNQNQSPPTPQPQDTPIVAPTPGPPSPRIQGLQVTVVTPPPTAAPRVVADATAQPTNAGGNPYNRGGVFVQGPSGINYVGVQPGQNAGTTPQTLGQMRVANQANFLTSGAGSIYSAARQQPALSYDEIFPGRPIHWVPDVDIVSSLPGQFYGHITEDVVSNLPVPCDLPVCPHELLIPNGTKLSGTYNADVQTGENRIQLHPTLLLFPNGTTLELTDVQGADMQGANGVKADVDNHVGRIYTVTLIGAIANGIGNAIALRSALTAPVSLGAATAQGFGQTLSDRATQAATNQLQQAPTLTVKAGIPQTFSFSQIQPLMPYRKTQHPTHE